MNTSITGVQLPNGSWTGALGLLQSGVVDTLAIDSYVTYDRSDTFDYATPFILERCGALMKRQEKSVSINIDSITAGMHAFAYVILFALLLLLFIISLLNEKWNDKLERNTSWYLLVSLFPCNSHMWTHQIGATRKVLMASIGFGILIVSALYQAEYSEKLMVPYRKPVTTLRDIEHLIGTKKARLLLDEEGSPISNYIETYLPILGAAIKDNPPIYIGDTEIDDFRTIDMYNGIYIDTESTILGMLSSIDSNLCKDYVFITFDEWFRLYSALIIRKERVDILETMNAIVAERMSYVDNYLQTNQLNDECRQHIFPVYTSNPTYLPLELVKINGLFALWCALLCLAIFILAMEIFWFRYVRGSVEVDNTFHIHLHIPNKHERVFEAYVKLIAEIESDD
jgi:hypothetical protein